MAFLLPFALALPPLMPSPLGSQLHPVAVVWILPPLTRMTFPWLRLLCPLLHLSVVVLIPHPVWRAFPLPLDRWFRLDIALHHPLLVLPLWKCAFLWPLLVEEEVEVMMTAPAQAPVHPLSPLTLLLKEGLLVGVAIPLATEVGLPWSHQFPFLPPTIQQPLS